MNKVVFFSSFINETHVQFESSLLKVITTLYPNNEYIFVGNTYHIGLVIDQLDSRTQIKTIEIWSSSRKSLMFDAFWRMLFIRNKSCVIHLTNYFPISVWTFFFLFANMNVIFMHAYWGDTQDRFLKIFYFFALYVFFLFKFKTKIFVLWEWIFNNIQKDRLFPKILKWNYSWINHPYFLHSISPDKIYTRSNLLNFGFFSWQSSNYKNIENKDFLDVRDFILSKWCKITIKPNIFLTSTQYSSLFQSIDYLIFLSRDPAYQYRCSCVLTEAIFYQKPIICFQSTITSHLFDKYGNIGFMYNSLQDMLNWIQLVIERSDDKIYHQQISNLSVARKDFVDINKFRKNFKCFI